MKEKYLRFLQDPDTIEIPPTPKEEIIITKKDSNTILFTTFGSDDIIETNTEELYRNKKNIKVMY